MADIIALIEVVDNAIIDIIGVAGVNDNIKEQTETAFKPFTKDLINVFIFFNLPNFL